MSPIIEGAVGIFTNAGVPVNGTDETQTLTLTGTPTGGTFKVSFRGELSAAIAYDASAATVQTALRALRSIGTGGCSVSGSAGGPWTVTFAGDLGRLAITELFVLALNSLTGGTTPTLAIAEGTAGVTATGRGAPTGGTLYDTTNAKTYQNIGTPAAPSWNSLGDVSPAEQVLLVINKTGVSIAADKIVAVTTLDATTGLPKIVLADADVAAHENIYVTTAAIADGAQGTVTKSALSAATLNTNSATTAGDAVYLDVTAGGFAHTAPTGATARVQVVGFVVVKSATVGQIQWLTGSSRMVGTNEIQAAAVTLAKVAPATLDGTVVKVGAPADVIGAIPVIHAIAISAGALADTDVVLTHKTRVINAWLELDGAGVSTTTLTVKNGATAITNAMAASGSDKDIVRCTSIDDAQRDIAAGGTLRVTSATGATQPAATVYVLGIRVA